MTTGVIKELISRRSHSFVIFVITQNNLVRVLTDLELISNDRWLYLYLLCILINFTKHLPLNVMFKELLN